MSRLNQQNLCIDPNSCDQEMDLALAICSTWLRSSSKVRTHGKEIETTNQTARLDNQENDHFYTFINGMLTMDHGWRLQNSCQSDHKLVVPHENMFSQRGPEKKRVLRWDQPAFEQVFYLFPPVSHQWEIPGSQKNGAFFIKSSSVNGGLVSPHFFQFQRVDSVLGSLWCTSAGAGRLFVQAGDRTGRFQPEI